MLTFYFAPGSSSMAPHIALHEIGVPFEARPLSFYKSEMRSPEYRAINPEAKVPALLVDGRLLTEVAGILYYLAKRHPEAALLPADIEAQAQAISWMSFAASTLHVARAFSLEHARKQFAVADRRLRDSQWAAGGQYSIADIHLFRLFWRFKNALEPAREDYPNLSAHHDRVLARPAVQKTCAIEAAIGYELPEYKPRR
jgi:glutathione S-transferase